MDAFAATRLLAGTAALLLAAISDVRVRRVPDRLWIYLGSFGLLLVGARLAAAPGGGTAAFGVPSIEALSLLACTAILFFAVFYGAPLFDERGFRLRPARIVLFLAAGALFVFPTASYASSGRLVPRDIVELYSAPVMVLVYQGLYWARVVHGGADAKGLIALTLLLPTYPDASPFPLWAPSPLLQDVLRVAFPFSLVIYLDAAVLFLAVPMGLLVRNAARGDLALPQALLGYRVGIQRIPAKTWLMERINNRGEHILVLFPKRGGDRADDIARLRAAGINRIWVTPQVPFMVPLLGGFWLAFFLGNVLLIITGLGR